MTDYQAPARGLVFFLNDVVQSCKVAIDEKPLKLISWAAEPILNCSFTTFYSQSFEHFDGPVGFDPTTPVKKESGSHALSILPHFTVSDSQRERERMERDGKVVVEMVGGRSTVTRCFSKYPLKFIVPNKGDSISCELTVGDGCTAVLTTQASTKVYKSMGAKCSEQVLETRIGSGAVLAVVPDPVTCFSTARYSQKQVFRVVSDSSLVIVDWITSGRHESGEKWDFDLYKSTNHIFLEDDQPLFLDTVLLERGSITSISERMQDYQVIAMVVLLGPKMNHIQHQVQEDVKRIMSEQLRVPSTSLGHQIITKPSFIASASVFGPKGIGLVVRVAAMTTESVYRFLQHQLACLEPMLGVSPYR